MDATLTGICIWIAGVITGVSFGATDAKNKPPMHIVAVVLGPMGVALLFAFCISLMMSLAPQVDMDALAQGIVEFFSQ